MTLVLPLLTVIKFACLPPPFYWFVVISNAVDFKTSIAKLIIFTFDQCINSNEHSQRTSDDITVNLYDQTKIGRCLLQSIFIVWLTYSLYYLVYILFLFFLFFYFFRGYFIYSPRHWYTCVEASPSAPYNYQSSYCINKYIVMLVPIVLSVYTDICIAM